MLSFTAHVPTAHVLIKPQPEPDYVHEVTSATLLQHCQPTHHAQEVYEYRSLLKQEQLKTLKNTHHPFSTFPASMNTSMNPHQLVPTQKLNQQGAL